jgi:hypothetical protein
MNTQILTAPAPSAQTTGFNSKIIYKNLAKHNPDIVVDSNGDIKRYLLSESPGQAIPLSVLTMALNHTFKRDPEFQRESDEHKKKTPQQIVADYLSGQFMGYISCYVYDNSNQPKLVIDGKHRLTHLEKFIKGELILKDKEASQFWNQHIGWLIDNHNNSIPINKILKSLTIGKNIPQVRYTDLPPLFQSYITSRVNINVFDINVKCFDENGNPQTPELKKVEEMYYRKFLRINQNSANMKPEDIIWGCMSEYNATSRSMNKDPFFNIMFNISNTDPKQQRKFNEMLFSLLLFMDDRTKWGSGGKSFISKINTPEYLDKKTNGDSIKFSDIFNRIIIPNFTKYLGYGNAFKLPDNMKGIESKGTNIKYMIYFMYKIHEMGKSLPYSLYEDKLPTIFLKNIIETGAEIISSSTKNKDGVFNPSSNIKHIYDKNTQIFENINFYRTRQWDRNRDIDPLFESIVRVCVDNYISL